MVSLLLALPTSAGAVSTSGIYYVFCQLRGLRELMFIVEIVAKVILMEKITFANENSGTFIYDLFVPLRYIL